MRCGEREAQTYANVRYRQRLMIEIPYKVVVIVDRDFGKRLFDLPPDTPVWIVNTPSNEAAAREYWREHPKRSHLTGVTVFNAPASAPPEQMLLSNIDTIDLHHGVYSADPPFTQIEVIGSPLTEQIKEGLADYGFHHFQITEAGFAAVRHTPSL